MNSVEKRQIIDAAKRNSSSRDYADECEACGCVFSFAEIGFRGYCYDCKPLKKITAKELDDALAKLVERYGEYDVKLSRKKSKNYRGSKSIE